MKSILKSDSFTEKTLTKKHPLGLRSLDLNEKDIKYSNATLNVNTKEIILDGIKISIRNEQITPPFIIEVEHSFPFLKMHFEIEGSSKYTPKNTLSVPVTIPNGHYNFFYLPKVKGTLRYDSTHRKTLEIIFTKAYLKKVFGASFKDASSEFGIALENNSPFLMWEQSKPITPQLHLIIDKIINCNYKGGLKKAYLESKTIEILTLFFDEIQHKKNNQKAFLNKDDYAKILNAEVLLKENLKKPPTISELSKLTGINQCKLKQNFKLVFNQPIFTYVTELRMEKAKNLITNQGYTIAETAYEVGYKNPQHFTAAFKKKHNYLPSSLKVVCSKN